MPDDDRPGRTPGHLPRFPFPDPTPTLTDDELRHTAYEIFVSSCRASSSRPLTFISSSGSVSSAANPSLQRSTTGDVVRNALGINLKEKRRESMKGGSGSEAGQRKRGGAGGGVGVGEVVRVQMRVSEQSDSRVRRALLRMAAGQLGRRIESTVLPLELLLQFQPSDFPKIQDYDAWQRRHIKVLEAGLLLYPHLPLNKTDNAAQRLRQIIRTALEKPSEIGRNSDASNALRSTVMSLACRSLNGSTSEMCHWVDGFPLNIRLYQVLLEACFDINEETSMVEDVDEVLDQIKKTWTVLGMNQALHNLCFAWVLFRQYVTTGQEENDLLFAASDLLSEVEEDSTTTKDQEYLKFSISTLKLILGWTEKRLLAYHDSFHSGNIDLMQNLVSMSVSSATILADQVSHVHGRKKADANVACQTVETYIRTSSRALYSQDLRTNIGVTAAYLTEFHLHKRQKKEKIRRSSKGQQNALPYLSVLAQDIREQVITEKEIFSPVFKRWHPLPAGVAVATLHYCFGSDLNNFITGIDELTPDAMQVLIAADKLEKDLVQIAVEDSVDSEDGGKSIIQEMSPYEVETVVSNLVAAWIKIRVDRLKEWVDRYLQQELWSPHANKERFAPSAVEVLRIADETLEAFFLLPIPMYQSLLPRLISGLDKGLQQYVTVARAGCGNRATFIPSIPPLTRCITGSKYNRVPKKKEKEKSAQRRKPQLGTQNVANSLGVLQLCVRINTLQHFRIQLEALGKKTFAYLKSSDPIYAEEVASGRGIKFELSSATCSEGIRQLCEAVAYKIVFQDLSPVLWDGLFIGDVSSSRIEPFLQELESYLETISSMVHDRVRTRVITNVMKASFDGFLLILLAGGPCRAFSLEDCQIIDEDFKLLEELFWSNGDGLPADLIDKYSSSVKSILPLFHANTDTLIEQFKHTTLETCGPSAKSKFPLPPTPAEWSPNEPNTMLRVLCLRNDPVATKFLKKTYNLPKML